ncbi:hypothetical protein [Geothrix limicola]|nr:hypothetical protein [Geothrix limicola]
MRTDCFGDSGSTVRNTDLSGYTIRALVPKAAGGYTVYAGSGLADGTFTIPSVPPGECLIQLSKAGSNYASHFWTNLSEIHLGGYSQGRPDWTAAPSATTLDIQPTVAPASNTYGEIIAPSLGMQRQAYFSTGLNAWRFSLAGSPLPEQGKDSGYFSYMTPLVSMGSGWSQTLAGILSLPSSGLQPGVTTQILAAPQGLAPNASQNLTIDADAFHAAVLAVDTSSPATNTVFTLKAQPYGSTVAPLAAAAMLVYQSSASGIIQEWNLPYSNPYPASWGGVVSVTRNCIKTYTIPGTTNTANWAFSVNVTYPKTALPSQPIAPLVGPPRNVKMNGQAMSNPTLSVGTTPLFSWDAPATGTPSYYLLSIYQLLPVSGSTFMSSTTVAQFRMTNNRLEVPPGLLSPGATYFGYLRAYYQGQYDPSHPTRLGFPLAYADYNTEIFVP